MSQQEDPTRDEVQPLAQQPPNTEAVAVHQEAHFSASYSGPIPPPSMLREYNDVLPGVADRIISMAEQQETHRLFLEKTAILGDSRRAYLGLVAGLAVALTGFGVVAYVATIGQPWLGGLIGVLDIGSIVYIFIHGSRERREERALKHEVIQELDSP